MTFILSTVFGVFYTLGVPAGFLWALRRFRVPELARTKQLNHACAELVQMYEKRHGHDLDGLCTILQVPKGTTELARAPAFGDRCSVLFRHVKDVAENHRVDLESVSGYLQSCNVDLKSELLDKVVAAHCLGDGALDEGGLRGVWEALLHENSIFSGEETFEELSDAQMVRLLKQQWHQRSDGEQQDEDDPPVQLGVRALWTSFGQSGASQNMMLDQLSREELQWKLVELIEHLWDLQVLGHSTGWWDGSLGQQEVEAKSYVGFLFKGFRISHYWWEVMVCSLALQLSLLQRCAGAIAWCEGLQCVLSETRKRVSLGHKPPQPRTYSRT